MDKEVKERVVLAMGSPYTKTDYVLSVDKAKPGEDKTVVHEGGNRPSWFVLDDMIDE